MSRTPGRQTNQPEDENQFAGEDITLRDLGQSLIELGKHLVEVGKGANKSTDFRPEDYLDAMYPSSSLDRDDEAFIKSQQAKQAHNDAVTQVLMGLRSFRGNYDYWERVAAEYALTHGFTQRRAAALLGVSVSTINRWAQNPVDTDEKED